MRHVLFNQPFIIEARDADAIYMRTEHFDMDGHHRGIPFRAANWPRDFKADMARNDSFVKRPDRRLSKTLMRLTDRVFDFGMLGKEPKNRVKVFTAYAVGISTQHGTIVRVPLFLASVRVEGHRFTWP